MKLWNNLELTNPEFLWLLLLIPLIGIWYFVMRKKDTARLKIANTEGFAEQSLLAKLKPLLYVLRLLALASLIVAMARPRLEALKGVATNFVNKRPNDRIGIVVYAGESFTQTPITSDKRIVINTIRKLRWGDLEGGTAIGMGLGSAVNRLKDSKAISKVIILLTDGVNNSGFVDPRTATELAKELDIKVYTIGLGTNGTAQFPVARDASGKLIFRMQPVEIDEELLKYIAKQTDGQYFRATDNEKLASIYDEINKLEKTEVEEFKYYNYQEKYRPLILLGGLLIFLEMLFRLTIFKSFI